MHHASAGLESLRSATLGERLPVALLDLDAFDKNLRTLLGAVRGKHLRIATKSVRVPELLRRALGAGARGLMTFSAAETSWLAVQGFTDLLLAYPTALSIDASALARVAPQLAGVAVDCEEHVRLLEGTGARIPCVIDVDMSYRPLGAALHLGVRRSPLRTPAEVVALAERIARSPSLRFAGLLAYEAQIAGLPDTGALRALKKLSRPDVARARRELAQALQAKGIHYTLFNGAGTGSLSSASAESALTELAAGSGLLAGHLFDRYDGLPLEPALYFALQVTRRPAPRIATCQGGGIIASGGPAADRLPRPVWPAGLRLLPREGAGEVQTPLALPSGLSLAPGDAVLFRPAKSGEPLERFAEVLLVQGGRILGRAPTYRGLGQCFQ